VLNDVELNEFQVPAVYISVQFHGIHFFSNNMHFSYFFEHLKKLLIVQVVSF